ncbi:MAG: hypothetical protein JWL65_930 [Gammaproteobacteria bacterium]|nr:hypothetical protein [Gammaproteobacteria bacterium]
MEEVVGSIPTGSTNIRLGTSQESWNRHKRQDLKGIPVPLLLGLVSTILIGELGGANMTESV